jgi:hypothetical protein
LCCVVSKDKKAKCRTVKTKRQVKIKYKQSTREYKKFPGGGGGMDICLVQEMQRQKPGRPRRRGKKIRTSGKKFLIGSLRFFIGLILLTVLWPWGRLSLRGKGGQCIGLTIFLPSCIDCLRLLRASAAWTSQGGSRPFHRGKNCYISLNFLIQLLF